MCNYCPKLEKLNLQTANCILQTANCILQTDKSSIHPPRHWQTRLYRYTATFEDLLVFDNNFEHVCREFNFCLSCRFAQIAFSSVQSQKLTELASLNSRSWRMATLERTLNSRKWQIPRKEANPVGQSSWQIQLANPIGKGFATLDYCSGQYAGWFMAGELRSRRNGCVGAF